MPTFKDSKSSWLVKAYNNYEFLNSPPARIIRILAEMVEPATRLRKHNIWNTVVFFGSARTLPQEVALQRLKKIERKMKKGKSLPVKVRSLYAQALRDLKMSRYYEDAAQLSYKLTRWFMDPPNQRLNFIVCSGGGPGIMEAANRGAKKARGRSMGLNIALPLEQTPNRYQTKEISFEFHYFFIRKFWFFYLAKALVIFPGGFGTLDEFFELLTIIQTEKSSKYMPVILYGKEYWNELINFNAFVKWGTVSSEDLKLFTILDDVDSAFEYLKRELTKHHFRKTSGEQKKIVPKFPMA